MEGMQGMDLGGGQGMSMKDMPMKDMPMGAKGQTHQASGTVKKVDAAKGTVIWAHGPVESLKWPSMTMGFKVKDTALFDKLAVGKQVQFDFVKEGGGYVVTADFHGQAVLVFFGYTRCPGICPTPLANMASARERLDEDCQRVQGLFATLDPARDTESGAGGHGESLQR